PSPLSAQMGLRCRCRSLSTPARRCAWTRGRANTWSGRSKLTVSVAGHEMIVDHTHGLHEGIANRRSDKSKTTPDQRLAHRRRFLGFGRQSAQGLPGVQFRPATDELPEKFVE